ncbi:MAG: hypothetical protein FWD24_01235 [Treponema sp.]|nr:hypothetical protein [Treponema sp.]
MLIKKLLTMFILIFSLFFSIYGTEHGTERISMREAFNNNDGACAFRVLLGIAETRVGQNLTLEQLIKAREMYFGSTTNRNWWVTIRRQDGQTNGSNNALEDVINIGLELLESNERAQIIQRITTSPNRSNIPAGTQASFIRVGSISTSSYHFLEGDADINMIYDPLDSLGFFRHNIILTFDAIRFYIPD